MEALRESFTEAGIAFPLQVFTEEEAAAAYASHQHEVARFGGQMPRELNHKLHLVFDWADALVHHPVIVDVVRDLLGPDLMCWTSNLFAKEAHSRAFVAWHQDAQYWGMSTDEVVTVWVALTPSTAASGCLRVIPGSQRQKGLPQTDTFHKENLLTRGQEITVRVDEAAAVEVVLQPGQASLHHVDIVHGSGPNRSDLPRVGLAIRYISSRTKKIGTPEYATLVAGAPGDGFLLEPRQVGRSRGERLAFHNQVMSRQTANAFLPAANSRSNRARLWFKRWTTALYLAVRRRRGVGAHAPQG